MPIGDGGADRTRPGRAVLIECSTMSLRTNAVVNIFANVGGLLQ